MHLIHLFKKRPFSLMLDFISHNTFIQAICALKCKEQISVISSRGCFFTRFIIIFLLTLLFTTFHKYQIWKSVHHKHILIRDVDSLQLKRFSKCQPFRILLIKYAFYTAGWCSQRNCTQCCSTFVITSLRMFLVTEDS